MVQGAHDAIDSTDNPLWLYSIKHYQKPLCAEFLLHGQDEYQLDINILLFIGWLTSEQKEYHESALLTPIHHWQRMNVQPIRYLRRKVKVLQHLPLYHELKALELNAEKMQQRMLFEVSSNFKADIVAQGMTLTDFERFSLSMKRYCKGRLNIEQAWLQALYQHLQP